MNIVCGKAVLGAKELFSTLGDVTIVPENTLSANTLQAADALIIRSSTKVDATLLKDTHLSVVATATAGVDHIDETLLQQKNIKLISAQGSNASSVAEYILHGVLLFSMKYSWSLTDKTLGIIGYGATGREVAKRFRALGVRVIAYDPILSLEEGLVSLKTLQQEADLLSLHCPLTKQAPYATYHMMDAKFFQQCKKGLLFINAARGPVMDTLAVINALESGIILNAIIDVWEEEPSFCVPLAQRVFLATPHIAGYSYTGRLKGSYDVYHQLCKLWGIIPVFHWEALQLSLQTDLIIDNQRLSWQQAQQRCLQQTYDIEKDDKALRSWCDLDKKTQAVHFKQWRQDYPKRLEHANYQISFTQKMLKAHSWLKTLDYKVGQDEF